MSRIKVIKLSVLILSLFLFNCATYKPQYNEENPNVEEFVADSTKVAHTFYFLGDAGYVMMNDSLGHLYHLKSELKGKDKTNTVIFLGDNIYPKGMPKKDHEGRELAEHRIDAQIDIVEDFDGKTIFIPGNHDYYNGSAKGLKREENYILKKMNNKDSFLPKNGCPLEKINITDELVLIVIDSQWYLDNWDKNPTKNDNCDIKNREQFFQEFESLIKKNANKTTIIAIHHPLFTGGPHGGQFSFNILQSIPNLLRKTSGVVNQDLQNNYYRTLKKRLVTLSQYGHKVIFASGHEHSLQYLTKDNLPQIVSGSASKTTAVRLVSGSEFALASLGYAKLEVMKNGASKVNYYSIKEHKDDLVFSKEIYPATNLNPKVDVKEPFPPVKKASIYTLGEVKRSRFYKGLWGKHYREYYGTTIEVPTVSLDTIFGGLKPIRKGGGQQSVSLRLEDKEGKEYVMRAMRKSATQFIQAAAFKDQYIEGQFEDTYTENLIFDIYTTAHPYAPYAIGTLADAIDIYHTNPKLYYVPKQNGLGAFYDKFGDDLYMIEERAASGHGDLESFGYSNKIISTDDMLENIRKSDDHFVDQETYIRARLFDMLIGDWDRHKDQWRWARFQSGNKKMYKPVPRDRDQAFSRYDGFLLQFLTRIIPEIKKMQVYEADVRNVRWFNTQAFSLDMALITQATLADWQNQVSYIQKNITEDLVDQALGQMPVEIKGQGTIELKDRILGRLNNLNAIAKEYYEYLAKYPVVRGNDKDNWFKINRLANGDTQISVYNIKNDMIGSKILEKTILNSLAKEIWVYGLDDADVFEVTGSKNKVIPLRLIGGQNRDEYIVETGKRVSMYDFKSKKNIFTTKKGRKKLSDDYQLNLFDYKKTKYSVNQLIPSIGYNVDDGLRLGANNVFTVYGFNRNPFSQQHKLSAHYYFATNGFDIRYSFELGHVFNKWNFLFESAATSPNYSMNFYGYGNETVNEVYENDFDQDYYRAKISSYLAYPSLKWRGRMGSEFQIGGLFEGIEVQYIEDRFIGTLPNFIDGRQYYVGAQTKYVYENVDNNAYPTLGLRASLEAGWKKNTNGVLDDMAYVIPTLAMAYKLVSNGNLVLATKFKGHFVFGDEFEFYNAASIGGKDGLRAYRNERFTGDTSYYQNTDLRWRLAEVKTGLLPVQIGIFGGFDYGRVWFDGEESKDWKTSIGGGLSLVGAEIVNINLSMFFADEGGYFNFGLGFNF